MGKRAGRGKQGIFDDRRRFVLVDVALAHHDLHPYMSAGDAKSGALRLTGNALHIGCASQDAWWARRR
jgi:hypothetical protein